MAKSTEKLIRIKAGEVGAYMDNNGLSSIVAFDAVEGWVYRLELYESERTKIIGAELIICSYDESTQKYDMVDGSELVNSVTKVRNLPCGNVFVSQSVVENAMSIFLDRLRTDYYEIDEVTAEGRTDNVGDGSGLTYDDLEVKLRIVDE